MFSGLPGCIVFVDSMSSLFGGNLAHLNVREIGQVRTDNRYFLSSLTRFIPVPLVVPKRMSLSLTEILSKFPIVASISLPIHRVVNTFVSTFRKAHAAGSVRFDRKVLFLILRYHLHSPFVAWRRAGCPSGDAHSFSGLQTPAIKHAQLFRTTRRPR